MDKKRYTGKILSDIKRRKEVDAATVRKMEKVASEINLLLPENYRVTVCGEHQAYKLEKFSRRFFILDWRNIQTVSWIDSLTGTAFYSGLEWNDRRKMINDLVELELIDP